MKDPSPLPRPAAGGSRPAAGASRPAAGRKHARKRPVAPPLGDRVMRLAGRLRGGRRPPGEVKAAHPASSRAGTAPAARAAAGVAERVPGRLAAAARIALRRPVDPPPAPAVVEERARRFAWGRAAVVGAYGVAAVAVIVVTFVFVFPTRTYLSQRHQLAVVTTRLQALDSQNRALAAEAAKLQTTAEIERLAREQYHMVRPGEQAYVILPAPATASPPTTAAPAAHAARSGGLWHALTSLF